MALIDDAPRAATVTAETQTEVFVIDRDTLRKRMASADPVINLLMRVLLDRLRTTQGQAAGGPAFGPTNAASKRIYADADRRALDLFKLEHQLKHGLAAGEFELTLQPIVRLGDLGLSGFEALMVWRHPTRGRMAPAKFIAIAERSGLVRELDNLALRLAIRGLKSIGENLGERAPELISLFTGPVAS